MPVTLPTAQDVRKAREQATTAVAGALQQGRKPLYAALGAGNAATEAVASAARRARSDVYGQADQAQARVADLQTRLTELQNRLTGLRGKLDSLDADELRALADSYRRAMHELYARLAVRGERVATDLAAQPQVKRAVGRVEHAADSAELRVERFVEEARVLAEDVLGRVTRRTRSAGEKAANRTEDVTEAVAEAVIEAGGEAASTTRSVTRKAAARTEPAKPPTPRAARTTQVRTTQVRTTQARTTQARTSKPAARRATTASPNTTPKATPKA